jgi:hypothetical protein
MICSRYKIDLLGSTSTTLLDVGDLMMEEPDMSWTQSVQAQSFVRGRHQRMIGRGNRSREMRFSKVLMTAESRVADFRTWLIQAGNEIELSPRCLASITIYDYESSAAATFLLRDAQVTQVDGRMHSSGEPYRSYVLRGGELLDAPLDFYYLRDSDDEIILDSEDNPIITF